MAKEGVLLRRKGGQPVLIVHAGYVPQHLYSLTLWGRRADGSLNVSLRSMSAAWRVARIVRRLSWNRALTPRQLESLNWKCQLKFGYKRSVFEPESMGSMARAYGAYRGQALFRPAADYVFKYHKRKEFLGKNEFAGWQCKKSRQRNLHNMQVNLVNEIRELASELERLAHYETHWKNQNHIRLARDAGDTPDRL